MFFFLTQDNWDDDEEEKKVEEKKTGVEYFVAPNFLKRNFPHALALFL